MNDLNLEQNNDITSLKGQPFINLKKLTKLNLKRCQIRDPIEPYAFQGLDLLRNLDLSENNINAFPRDAMKSLGHLETLEIGLNNIQTLTFQDMHSLKDLTNFSITGCRNIEFSLENSDVFRNNANLHEINITRCSEFTHLPPEIFTNLPHLKKLNFHQSGLTHISQDVADWSALEYFDLSNNPLKCDCDLGPNHLLNSRIVNLHQDIINLVSRCLNGTILLRNVLLRHLQNSKMYYWRFAFKKVPK